KLKERYHAWRHAGSCIRAIRLLRLPGGPDPQSRLLAARDDPLPVDARTDGQGVDEVPMALERKEVLAGFRVPDPHGPIPAGRDDPPSIPAVAKPADRMVVSPVGEDFPAVPGIPDLHPVILAGRRKPAPVGAECDRQ